MRWLITGANGMLGQDLTALLQSHNETVIPTDAATLDITDPAATAAISNIDVLVNCAAYTAVDAAESNEPQVFILNATGPQLLARAAHQAGAAMVQISTDYVFAGNATAPYPEGASLAPISAYGRTKAAGEWAVAANNPRHYIIRTAWLYGAHGNCFPKTMARLASTNPTLTVVDDQVGQPTWTMDLSDLIYRIVTARAPYGVYHGTSTGQASWFDFTQAIVASMGKDPAMVQPIDSGSFQRPAPRPAYSVLAHTALDDAGIAPIGPWQERWQKAAQTVLDA